MLTLPAHTTDRLESLYVSVFSPFKNYFRSHNAAWMENNPGVEVKRFKLAKLTSKAFKRAITPSNIKDGFRRTRIWSLNYDAFMDDTGFSQEFHVDGQEEGHVQIGVEVQEQVDAQADMVLASNMISFCQTHLCGDDDEHVCET